MRWWVRAGLGTVGGALLLSLSGPDPASPFLVETGLRPSAAREGYAVVADGYALRLSYATDVLGVVDLADGSTLWTADPRVGDLGTWLVSDGTLVVSGGAKVGEATDPSRSQTAALDLRTGRELWRRPNSLVGRISGGVVPIYCNGCAADTVGVDLRTGATVWRTPRYGLPNVVEDDAALFRGDDDGTLRSIDLRTGAVDTRGALAPGSWIVGWSDRYLLVEPPDGADDSRPDTATVYDRATLRKGQTFPYQSGIVPRTLWLCGELVCDRRDDANLVVYDLATGVRRYQRPGFRLSGVVDRPGGGVLLVGTQRRSEPTAGKGSTLLLEPETGAVLADLGDWEPLVADGGRLWMVRYPERRNTGGMGSTGTLLVGGTWSGVVELSPGSPLRVSGQAPLGGAYDRCDLRHAWLLCEDTAADEGAVVALRLKAPASTGAHPEDHWS